jgi:serine kinase of HPr protein (carbohydrate metabolism regulator)
MNTANIHASCVLCGNAGIPFGAPADGGVLLLGDSGSGKSDLALRLIGLGAKLVADDRCEIFFDGVLRARPPRNLAGLIEINGVGIIAMPFAAESRIALVVRAGKIHPDRLPRHCFYEPPPVVAIPHHLRPPEIQLDPFAASAPARILSAVAAFENQLFREDILS